MKKISLLIISILMTGCSVRIDGYQFNNASKICSSHGGVSSFKAATLFGLIDADRIYYVFCNDGTYANVGEAVKL